MHQAPRRYRPWGLFCAGILGACSAFADGIGAVPAPPPGPLPAPNPAVADLAIDQIAGLGLDLVSKNVDVVALESLVYPGSPYMAAASQVFQHVLHPYFAALDQKERDAVLQRMAFHCSENLADPVAAGHALAFPVQLQAQQAGALVWHCYACSFSIDYQDVLGGRRSFSSPVYTVNQLDIRYGTVTLEPAVAMQNYNLGGSGAPDYAWLGRYVQPLNLMLRESGGGVPAGAIAGVNAGFDYRVDAWKNYVPEDNPCPPRYAVPEDRQSFYTQHPPPAQCPMDADSLPVCASGTTLPIADDLGDSLVYLAPAQRAKSWRSTPFQSYNCGSIGEELRRGALILYADDVDVRRTSASKYDVAELSLPGKPAVSAIGAGPVLVSGGHFVYDEAQSEEGRPIDNYEVGGQTGVGYERDANGVLTLHLVNIDGEDHTVGMHDWLMGLYFLSPYAHSSSAVAFGNGGDATLWINPAAPAVQAVLSDAGSPNHAFFQALFVQNGHPGIVSNCSGFGAPPIACGARPLHDGLFLYAP